MSHLAGGSLLPVVTLHEEIDRPDVLPQSSFNLGHLNAGGSKQVSRSSVRLHVADPSLQSAGLVCPYLPMPMLAIIMRNA